MHMIRMYTILYMMLGIILKSIKKKPLNFSFQIKQHYLHWFYYKPIRRKTVKIYLSELSSYAYSYLLLFYRNNLNKAFFYSKDTFENKCFLFDLKINSSITVIFHTWLINIQYTCEKSRGLLISFVIINMSNHN